MKCIQVVVNLTALTSKILVRDCEVGASSNKNGGIGHKMATMEIKATLVAILSRYTPKLVPNQNSRGIYSATLALKNGYRVEMVERVAILCPMPAITSDQ